MSFFDSLITGGIIIGKICQSLASSRATYTHPETGTQYFGDIETSGVRFYRKQVPGTASTVYAFNMSSSSDAQVTVPNSGGDSLTYFIPPMSSLPFPEAESSQIPPSTPVIVGLMGSSGSGVSNKPAFFRLAFGGLKIGSSVSIGSFSLKCSTTQLIILSAAIPINAMVFASLFSDKGVSVTNTSRIEPDKLGLGAAQTFNFDFIRSGINTKLDAVSGDIMLESTASSDVYLPLSAGIALPADLTDLAFLASFVEAL